jgi:hypothetical protein
MPAISAAKLAVISVDGPAILASFRLLVSLSDDGPGGNRRDDVSGVTGVADTASS